MLRHPVIAGRRAVAVWREAPIAVRLLALTTPFFLATLLIGGHLSWIPSYTVSGTSLEVRSAVSTAWSLLGEGMRERAAVELSDDFRSGLTEWRSPSYSTGSWVPTSWTYDAAGFVQPGRFALYRPSVELRDYRFEFLAQIDQKGIGTVVRASDASNYYAINLVVVRPGPLPMVQLVRYSVVKGREGPHITRPLTFPARNDMWYHVRLDVRGREFTLIIQDRLADYWTESRLEHGGVGFFCRRGERARLGSVKISHHSDAIGRLCAYLAPRDGH